LTQVNFPSILHYNAINIAIFRIIPKSNPASPRVKKMKELSRFSLAVLLLAVTLALVVFAALPHMKNSSAPTAWESYLKNPYSVPAIEKYLWETGNPSRWIINGRIISGVYCARNNNKPLLYIVELVPPKSGHFRSFLGTLMAFDAKGKHLKTWDRETIEKTAVEPDSAIILSKILAGQIIDLPDINGDSYSEIPAYRFSDKKAGGTLIVYRTRSEMLSCLFAIDCTNFQSGLKWGEFYLERSVTEKQGLILKMQPYAMQVTNNNPGTTEPQKVTRKYKSPFTKVVKPPSMELVIMKRDLSRPPETLAEFTWAESQKTFIGPESGLSGVWNVLDVKDRVMISRTMTAPKQPGRLNKLKYLVFSCWKKKPPGQIPQMK
jgi:hypothetical protein